MTSSWEDQLGGMSLEEQATAGGRRRSSWVWKDRGWGSMAAAEGVDGPGQAMAVGLESGGDSECIGQNLEVG